jgi:hypothetical protein
VIFHTDEPALPEQKTEAEPPTPADMVEVNPALALLSHLMGTNEGTTSTKDPTPFSNPLESFQPEANTKEETKEFDSRDALVADSSVHSDEKAMSFKENMDSSSARSAVILQVDEPVLPEPQTLGGK